MEMLDRAVYVRAIEPDFNIFVQNGENIASTYARCIDYVTQKKTINEFYTDAQARGFVPYASDLNLDKLTINPGHGPS